MNRSHDAANRHQRAWELIPWVLNGTADETERQLVEEHLHGCADCRGEYEFHQRLQAHLVDADAPVADHRPALARLRARLDAEALPTTSPRPRRWLTGALAAALVVVTIALSVTGTALWTQDHAAMQKPAYLTLTTPPAGTPAGTIRAVFAPTLSLAELQALLQTTQLQIVAGPNAAGAWVLAPTTTTGPATTPEQLRRLAGVRFAEPLGDTAR